MPDDLHKPDGSHTQWNPQTLPQSPSSLYLGGRSTLFRIVPTEVCNQLELIKTLAQVTIPEGMTGAGQVYYDHHNFELYGIELLISEVDGLIYQRSSTKGKQRFPNYERQLLSNDWLGKLDQEFKAATDAVCRSGDNAATQKQELLLNVFPQFARELLGVVAYIRERMMGPDAMRLS